ncbi:MAG: glutaredoxin domain-containing protein [Candidatus Nanopelagicales bacterium]
MSEASTENPLTIYSTPWCGYCTRLKTQLNGLGIDFVDIDITTDEEAAKFVETQNGGDQLVPTVKFPSGEVLSNPSLKQVQEALS